MQVTNNMNHSNANGGNRNGENKNGNGGNNNGCTYNDFLACNLRDFDGKGGAIVLTRWIKKMESVMDISGCVNNQKVRYASSSLINKALTWWNTQIQARGREVAMGMTWEEFKALMVEEFCPSNEMEKLETKFWNHSMVGANHAYKVNAAKGVNAASEEVSTAELVSTAYEFDLLKWDQQVLSELVALRDFARRYGSRFCTHGGCIQSSHAQTGLEMLDQTIDRLEKLVSQLELLDEKLSQEDRNKVELETMSMDDLYHNLKVYEPEVKGMSSSSSSTQNIAFVSSSNNNTSSSNEAVNVAHGVTTASTQIDQAEEGPNYVLMAYSSSSSDTELRKKLEKIQKEKDSIQVNVDKFENASKSLNKLIECQIADNCKKGLGYEKYNAVPPPYTGNFMPPTHDLSFTGLDEFVNKPVVENRKSNEEVSKGNPQMDLQDQGVIDSGCSRYMTGNMSYLIDYEAIDGGYVNFEGNPKGGKFTGKGDKSVKNYILLPLWTADPPYSHDLKSSHDDRSKPSSDDGNKVDEDLRKDSECKDQEKEDNVNSTKIINAASINEVNAIGGKTSIELPFDINMPALEDYSIFNSSRDDEDDGTEADMNNLDTTIQVSPIPTTRIHKDYPLDQVIVDLQSATQTRKMLKFLKEHRIEAIRLFLAYASFKDFMVYQMDVKSDFLYEKIEEVVYVCEPPGFEDLNFPDRVYKVEKALYGLHQVPRAWYETLSTYLLDNGFQRGKINKTLFIKRHKGDILLVQVYADDIIFGSTKKELCNAFEKLMHEKFQISSMGELTFSLGLHKFRFTKVKTTSTPMETQKPLLKDEDGEEVDVHMYRSMVGSLMYLTSSRPDIMFAVCACARYQVNPKVSHLHAVKRIFRYLKGQPKLGLWYPKDSPFDLVAYTDSDYAPSVCG
ncbi:putative ribonuclease H-like domain-containing protein [Tanacetum coccineum]